MRRRQLLGATALAVSLTAGCVGDSDTPGTDDSDDPGGSGDPGDTGDTTPPGGDDGGRLVLDRIERPTAAVRLNDLGASPAGAVPAAASLSERRRAVVEAAVDGEYRTDEAADWLTAFVAEVRVVRRDGEYLRLEHTLPRHTVRASAVDPGTYMGRIAEGDTYREAVTHDGVVETGLVRVARDEGYTTVDPWPSLLSLLEEHEAVRYRGTVYELSLSVEDPGPPYTVTAERVAPTEVVDRPVWDATDESERVRAAVRAAGETEGVYADDLPERLLDAVADHQYVYLDGTFYFAGLERRGALPARVEATVVESALPEPRVRIAVHNDADHEVELSTGAPTPFGVVELTGEGGGEHLLWTEAYRESEHVFTEGRRVTGGEDIGLTVPVPPGERVSETYTVLGDLSAGEYALRDDVGVETGAEGQGGTLPIRVFFRVESG